MKKIENGETILYINQYYEVNLTTTNYTSYYYSGGRLVAMKQGDDINFMHQDHLSGTALVTNDDGTVNGTMKYFPFGSTRTGAIPTDIKFTGQRLDDTGLYFYNARYYDAVIGRFISPDTIIPDPMNPQAFNRYTYCLNNPLKYTDPSGHQGYDWYAVLMAEAAKHKSGQDINQGIINKALEDITNNILIPIIVPVRPPNSGYLIWNEKYKDDNLTISRGELEWEGSYYYRIDMGIDLVLTEDVYDILISHYSMDEIAAMGAAMLDTFGVDIASFGRMMELQGFIIPAYKNASDGNAYPIPGQQVDKMGILAAEYVFIPTVVNGPHIYTASVSYPGQSNIINIVDWYELFIDLISTFN